HANATAFGNAEPQLAQRSLWPVASRPGRSALGYGKRMAYSAQCGFRRKGNRLLGACTYPHHVPANPDLAFARDSKGQRARMGLPSFLRIRWLSSRHNFFHVGLETR